MSTLRFLVVAFLCLSACKPTEAHPEPPPLPSAPADSPPASLLPSASTAVALDASPPAAPVASANAAPTGTATSRTPFALATWWTSLSCPARSYKRTLNLLPDHTFQADDVVHPCPQECVVQWTDRRTGSWTSDGKTVSLVVKKEDGPEAERRDAVALATTLTVDAASHTLHEASAACEYKAQ